MTRRTSDRTTASATAATDGNTKAPGESDDIFTLHRGDARDIGRLLKVASARGEPLLTATITSPPYADLKDYGHRSQIGFGQTPAAYLTDLRRVFSEIAAHTRPEGCLWIVVDTLRPATGNGRPRSLRLLPFELAEELRTVGWTLRDVVIWEKDRTLPWSGPGRMRNTFEYVLFFVRSKDFKYRDERLRDATDLAPWWRRFPERYSPLGKAPTNLWRIPIPVQGAWGGAAIQHACPLPPELVERMVNLSTDPGDVVLDPFAGSGVVLAEAERLGRRPLGMELVSSHVTAFHRTVRPLVLSGGLASPGTNGEAFKRAILGLRTIKYPRQLLAEVARANPEAPRPTLAFVFTRAGLDPPEANRQSPIVADCCFLFDDLSQGALDEFVSDAREVADRPPLSKFGLTSSIEALPMTALARQTRGRRLYGYVSGRGTTSLGRVRASDLRRKAVELADDRFPPIVSNVELEAFALGEDT